MLFYRFGWVFKAKTGLENIGYLGEKLHGHQPLN